MTWMFMLPFHVARPFVRLSKTACSREDSRPRRARQNESVIFLQGYLAHKNLPYPRALQWANARDPTNVMGGGQFLVSEVHLDVHNDLLRCTAFCKHVPKH